MPGKHRAPLSGSDPDLAARRVLSHGSICAVSSPTPTEQAYIDALDIPIFDEIPYNDVEATATYIPNPMNLETELVSLPGYGIDEGLGMTAGLLGCISEADCTSVLDQRACVDFGASPLSMETPSIPTILTDPSSSLVEYYFKEVAGVFSCFDSQMNPFRSTVASIWTTSPLMYRTLQSMAAACLLQERPAFRQLGKKLRAEAISLAGAVSERDPNCLLALLMIGQTSSWFEPNDLGIQFFKQIQSQLKATSRHWTGLLGACSADKFFRLALTYWQMLLSFVTSELDQDEEHLGEIAGVDLCRIPHPWTGICDETQALLRKVGHLVRTQRARFRGIKFLTQKHLRQSAEAIEQAKILETRLIAAKRWSSIEIVSSGDAETPTWHLQLMAEVYCCVGLLNLYRVFPDLLHRRYCYEAVSGRASVATSDSARANDYLEWLQSTEDFSLCNTQAHDAQLWLTTYALETLRLLESVPTTSRTRCLQPLLLVSCASELRVPPTEMSESSMSSGQLDPPMSSSALQTLQGRRFVRGRLRYLLSALPPLPTQMCLDLVEHVWSQHDAGIQDVYWIDVMLDQGLQTTMG